jgi:signal peptidase I
LFISIRSAASCCQPRQLSSCPRGARMMRAPVVLDMYVLLRLQIAANPAPQIVGPGRVQCRETIRRHWRMIFRTLTIERMTQKKSRARHRREGNAGIDRQHGVGMDQVRHHRIPDLPRRPHVPDPDVHHRVRFHGGHAAGGRLPGAQQVGVRRQCAGHGTALPGYDTPQRRGDIIVFRGHHEPIDLVKRLVGMPGDTLEMRDGVLFVNGSSQDEPYARHTDPNGDGGHPWMEWQGRHHGGPPPANRTYPTRDNWGPIAVPDDHFFALGDNRDESLDSRYWGLIGAQPDQGPRRRASTSPTTTAADGGVPILSRIRWGRIGERLK